MPSLFALAAILGAGLLAPQALWASSFRSFPARTGGQNLNRPSSTAQRGPAANSPGLAAAFVLPSAAITPAPITPGESAKAESLLLSPPQPFDNLRPAAESKVETPPSALQGLLRHGPQASEASSQASLESAAKGLGENFLRTAALGQSVGFADTTPPDLPGPTGVSKASGGLKPWSSIRPGLHAGPALLARPMRRGPRGRQAGSALVHVTLAVVLLALILAMLPPAVAAWAVGLAAAATAAAILTAPGVFGAGAPPASKTGRDLTPPRKKALYGMALMALFATSWLIADRRAPAPVPERPAGAKKVEPRRPPVQPSRAESRTPALEETARPREHDHADHAQVQVPQGSLIPVRDPKTGKWGFKNSLGELIIGYQFERVTGFRDGTTIVTVLLEDGTRRAGVIDEQGRYVLPAQFEEVRPMQKGLWAVRQDGKWGLADETFAQTGLYAAQPLYDHIPFPASGGTAVVGVRGADNKMRYGYINTRGQSLIEPAFDRAYPLQDDRAVVQVDGKWGVIDGTGRFVLEARYDRMDPRPAANGTLTVGVKTEGGGMKYGHVDSSGQPLYTPVFDAARPFTEDLAAVAVNGKWGYIDRTGRWVIEPRFTRAGEFRDGKALVSEDGTRQNSYSIDSYGRRQ